MIQACLNGGRTGPAVPATPSELAADGARAVAAGADELHVHPRGDDGRDTLDPARVAEVVAAIRQACPGVPLGLTTGLWAAGGDAARRLALVSGWDVLPDHASVNVSEPGFGSLCSLLAARGVGIEAGVWSVADAHRVPEGDVHFLRVLVEVGHGEPSFEVARAREISSALAGMDVPQLHHGEGLATWAVIEAAAAAGHDVRIGLEDTTVLPDGTPARDNAQLVAEAVRACSRRPRTRAQTPFRTGRGRG
jgi:uncharacterized protein (DUF849 family)